ncbi:TetR/AcrR family transcriptional regulator [Rhodococcus globerulus]|uniref:TetR/AcrR family transcriptional regulator n=1 Tax=Rhodococcus globerulus TaxID=33008 RepID=A0ABU4C1G6_RHOGO|nr:TetR/AcrR family transcriptional regulator [Rhodococcus globerulus]MDV6270228.1 TetR/AcrR family transcriptional regulator [Rhodococcus globerulus]
MTIDTSDGTPAASPDRPAAPKTTPKKTLRPRNRKAQIIAVAREQFGQSGYHNVSMEGIASAVGITAGALYRHFPNKQELLAQAMLDGSSSILAILENVDSNDSKVVFTALVRYGLDNNFRSLLFDQEARNLTPERRVEARAGVRGVVNHVANALRNERPELSDADAALLAWALTSIAFSPARHRTSLPRKRFEALLGTLFDAVRIAPVLPEDPPAAPQPSSGFSHTSRRESLLAAAITLFNRRGYQSVTMDDIGAAAGIPSSSIYTHFDSKAEVLQAILSRGNETLRLGLVHALRNAQSRDDALARVVQSYADSVISPDSAIGILIEESANLPEEAQASAHTAQREYIDEWVHLLGNETNEARATVLAAIGLINDLTRVRLESRRRAIEDLAIRILATQTIRPITPLP